MSRFFELNAPRSRLFEELILKSWWLIVIFFLCFFAYDQAAKKREKERINLQHKLSDLDEQKMKAERLGIELQSKIDSFEDPAWIEMTLMRGLGLVPEGQIKVVFSTK